MKLSYVKYLTCKTEDDYNKIASLFSNKRSYLTQDLLDLKKYIPENGEILDFGCGNGRLSELVKDINRYYGVDISKELIKIAKLKYPDYNFQHINPMSALPFESKSFDLILSLAVLHHIPSVALRIKLLREIKRVLKPNKNLIITVWNLNNNKSVKKKINTNNLLRFLQLSKLDRGDIFYPFKDSSGKTLVQRYIHSFTEDELIELLIKAGFKIIESGINMRGKKVVNSNIYVICSY